MTRGGGALNSPLSTVLGCMDNIHKGWTLYSGEYFPGNNNYIYTREYCPKGDMPKGGHPTL